MLPPHPIDPQPNRQSSAAPLQPLAPLEPTRALIASVLREGLMRDGRTFEPIQRPADGSRGWRTLKWRCLEPDEVAAMVLDPDLVIGLRHRHRVRLVAVDLDNHHGQQNWRPDAPRLIALQAAAEAAGVVPVLIRTPNGMHLWMALPAAVPVVRAHWLVQVLLLRAQTGPVEVFPSLAKGSPIDDPKARPASHGIRLPGQAGSALWVGDRWLADDPVLIWQEIKLALAVVGAGPAWDELQEEAAALERQHKRPCPAGPRVSRPQARPASHREGALIQWTAAGQSNRVLFDLGIRGYRRGHRDPEALAAYIESEALAAPGFDRWASADTKDRLRPWAKDKAVWILRRPPTGKARSDDPGRNHRLRREAFCAILKTAERAAREHGDAALSWSARKVAAEAGIARTTLKRLRFHWPLRVMALLYRRRSEHPAVGGSDPSFKGGQGVVGGNGGESLAVLSESINPSAHCTAGIRRGPPGHHCRPPSTADPPPMPTLAATITTARRDLEREELARWLGAAV